jgi:hypothetical protein
MFILVVVGLRINYEKSTPQGSLSEKRRCRRKTNIDTRSSGNPIH